MSVFFTYRTSNTKCFFRSYVFVDCGYEEKRKSKSNIVCLCGLQWVCFSRIGHLTLNVSSGRMSLWTAATKKREKRYCMSLRTAMIVFVKCRRSESKCFKRSYVFADCNGCGLLRTQGKSKSNIVCLCRLQWLCLVSVGDLTAMIVFVKCRRSESKCFKRSYVFADCGHEDKRKSKSNIVCLCGLQWFSMFWRHPAITLKCKGENERTCSLHLRAAMIAHRWSHCMRLRATMISHVFWPLGFCRVSLRAAADWGEFFIPKVETVRRRKKVLRSVEAGSLKWWNIVWKM